MKKYIIGFVLGAVLFSSGVVFAKAIKESSWYFVDTMRSVNNKNYNSYEKIYDEETNVICYSNISKGGISCLKNN